MIFMFVLWDRDWPQFELMTSYWLQYPFSKDSNCGNKKENLLAIFNNEIKDLQVHNKTFILLHQLHVEKKKYIGIWPADFGCDE